MDVKEATAVINQAVKVIQERDGLSYDRAFMVLSREKPGLVRAFETIRRKAQERQERERNMRGRLNDGKAS